MTKKTLTPWLGISSDFSPEGLAGFVYMVVNVLTKRRYIGRKYFTAKTSKKVRGRKRRQRTYKESDWRYYKSSSEDLKADIARLGPEAFEFSILSLHKTRAETNYEETRQHFIRDVLYAKLLSGEYEFYNTCILHRYWRKRLTTDSD